MHIKCAPKLPREDLSSSWPAAKPQMSCCCFQVYEVLEEDIITFQEPKKKPKKANHRTSEVLH
jgi:hypothetical protein